MSQATLHFPTAGSAYACLCQGKEYSLAAWQAAAVTASVTLTSMLPAGHLYSKMAYRSRQPMSKSVRSIAHMMYS